MRLFDLLLDLGQHSILLALRLFHLIHNFHFLGLNFLEVLGGSVQLFGHLQLPSALYLLYDLYFTRVNEVLLN